MQSAASKPSLPLRGRRGYSRKVSLLRGTIAGGVVVLCYGLVLLVRLPVRG